MSDQDYQLNTKNLDQMIKALKDNLSRARVGILGSGAARNGEALKPGKSLNAGKGRPKTKFDVSNNASIGALHEFGSDKMPKRSFLRTPISENLQRQMESAGAFNKDALSEVIKQGTVVPWLENIAGIAVAIVLEAFATGGGGKWPAWKHPEERLKNSNAGMLLVDTHGLRDSITSEVK